MENARTLTEPPANPLMDRLKGIAEAMLDAFEATPMPKDHAEIGKAARTLISLTRLIKLAYDEAKPRASRAKPVANKEKAVASMNADTEPHSRPVPLNRQQRRREEKLCRTQRSI